MFGTNIRIKFTPGPSMPAVGNDIAMRDAAGQPAPTDVWIAFSRSVTDIIERHLFQAADWHALMPERITPNLVEADGVSVKATTSLPGITYNPQELPFKPEKLTDFLKPDVKGKIATTPYSAGFDILAAKDLYGPVKSVEFAKEFSGQVAGLIRCDDNQRIASGEFLALVLDCGGTDIFKLAEKGAPIAHMTPRDYPVVSYFYLSVPKRAPHPAAGKLFVVFALTPEGQAISWQTWHADLHLFPESQTRKQVAEVEHEIGGKLIDVDIAWQLQNTQGRETWEQLNKILAVRK
jgi:ABC-type Fe3+ transport system substrate-binding protein